MTGNFDYDVREELCRARRKHGRIGNLHEGYAVLLEEVDEVWDCVRNHSTDHKGDVVAYAELVQVAAMARRIIEDVILPVGAAQ